MARFVLTPCKLREMWLVPQKNQPPIILTWPELLKRLAPSRDPRAVGNLQFLQPQSFVGLLHHPLSKTPSNFVMTNADRSGSIERVLKRDPTFAGRLVEVFRVEEAEYDARMTEIPGMTPRPGVPR